MLLLQWVPGDDFKVKLLRFYGPSSLTVWAFTQILRILKPMIKKKVMASLPPELGYVAAMQDGLHFEAEAEFNIVGNQAADKLEAQLSSDKAASCLRFGSSMRQVQHHLTQLAKLAKLAKLPKLPKLLPSAPKLPPMETVVQMLR